MRIVRVRHEEHDFYAAINSSETVRCLSREAGLPKGDVPLAEVELLPLVRPSKVVCVGLNYHDHAREMNLPIPSEPVLFLKPPSAVIGAGDPIVIPAGAGRVDYEAELALVMGKTARRVAEEDALGCLFGYACANDVTAREVQKRDGQWTRAKGYDTFCPVGPWIETSVPDENALRVRTLVNREVRQEGNTREMIFSPRRLVSFISHVMTLLPGDVILTGTPAGIGPITPGDEVSIEIEHVGLLLNPVAAGKPEPGAENSGEPNALQ